jgi:hypothetical protein
MTLPATLSASVPIPALSTASGDRTNWRFMEFFTAAIQYGGFTVRWVYGLR